MEHRLVPHVLDFIKELDNSTIELQGDPTVIKRLQTISTEALIAAFNGDSLGYNEAFRRANIATLEFLDHNYSVLSPGDRNCIKALAKKASNSIRVIA